MIRGTLIRVGELRKYAQVVTSQNGEDGMIAEIFRRLGVEQGTCVEFGAWDGHHLSNVWDLWRNRQWSALLIEGDRRRFGQLKRAVQGHQQARPLHRFVQPSGPDSLDAILASSGIGRDFELLCVDIDGDDYRVWEAMTEYRPKVVVVEFNGSFPATIHYVQTSGEYAGSSARALVELAKSKGYVFLDLTNCNIFFLRDDLVDAVGLDIGTLDEEMSTSGQPLVYSDYSGRHHLIRPGQWGYTGFKSHRPVWQTIGTRWGKRTYRRLRRLLPLS